MLCPERLLLPGRGCRYVHGPSGDGCKYVPPSGMGEQVLSVRASAPRARIGTASRDAASKRKCHDAMQVAPHRASRRPFKLTSFPLQLAVLECIRLK